MSRIAAIPGGRIRRSDGELVYRQIYERVRSAILAGELKPDARLPSARGMASQLAVARGTVEAAYQLLQGEGYVVARGTAGTFVAVSFPTPPARRTAQVRRPPSPVAQEGRLKMRLGVPALDAFPRKLWSRLAGRAARAVGPLDLDYQDPAGLPFLRRTLAVHLRIARGIACEPAEILITGGYQSTLALVARAILRPGDKVWVEDPGYPMSRRALEQAGARLVPVSVDAGGLDVASGLATAPRARLALVTPCHQFPTGVTLSIQRRLALLDWAADAGAWIVEDDYDSEFRYRGRPLPALKSLDRPGRVLYAGTFSKVLFPSLRMGYLVVPGGEADRFRMLAQLFQPAPTSLMQSIVARFIEAGYLARHVRRMRELYAERRRALADALTDIAAGRFDVEAPPGGMHLILKLPRGSDDVGLERRANAYNLWPAPLSLCAADRRGTPGLLLGFTNIPAASAAQAARRLIQAID